MISYHLIIIFTTFYCHRAHHCHSSLHHYSINTITNYIFNILINNILNGMEELLFPHTKITVDYNSNPRCFSLLFFFFTFSFFFPFFLFFHFLFFLFLFFFIVIFFPKIIFVNFSFLILS